VKFCGRTLNNAGAAIWDTGAILAFNGAVINNLAGASFEVHSGSDLVYSVPSYSLERRGPSHLQQRRHVPQDRRHAPNNWDNAFTELGPGTDLDVVFKNSGTVDAQVGQIGLLDLGQGVYSTTGTFNSAAGASLYLINGYLTSAAHVQGAGHVAVVGTTIAGVYDVTGSSDTTTRPSPAACCTRAT